MKRWILMVVVLALLLVGCGNSDSNHAATQHEGGNSDYDQAMALYEEGKYGEAIVLFQKLGEYEDSAEMIVECQYALAVEAFENAEYELALNYFTALENYKDTKEYRMEASWRALHAYIEEHGEKLESTTKLSYVNKSIDGQIIQTDLATVSTNPEQLIFYNGNKIEIMGIVNFSDLAITITRGNPEAPFQISTKLTGLGTISNTSGDGILNISSATANTQLNPNNYLYFYTDIYGKSHSESEMDSTSRAALQEHYTYVLEGVSAILGQTGLGITLSDLGFTAMG